MILTKTDKDGKPQIIKDKSFCIIQKEQLPTINFSFGELFNKLDKAIQEENSKVTGQALNNAHGDWYEWLLAIASWNLFVSGKVNNLAFLLPNTRQFDVATLYNDSLFEKIYDLRRKILETTEVELITSNPDFVIINGQLIRAILGDMKKIDKLTIENISFISNLYKNFAHSCNFEDIKGYIGAKSSLRPDRRLQLPHEGSLMKALYVHLQTRNWIISPPGLKYYAISRNIRPSDKKALKTVATHSILTVHSKPQAAVDEAYKVDSFNDANEVLSSILN